MLYSQAAKKVYLEPQSFTNGQTASLVVDRINCDYATIDVQMARSNVASNVPSTLKIQESDVTNATTFADIIGGSLTSAFTSANTTAGNIVTFDVDCRSRKRYLQVVAVPVTTQVIAITAQLGRTALTPVIAADKSVDAWLVL